MVKLASVREIRIYGPRPSRARSEYMNAGLYVLATVFLAGGFVAQFSWEPKSGLVLLLIGLGLMIVVNGHDLMAHIVGVDCRLGLVEFDLQLLVVEFAVPVVQALGALVYFLGIFLVFIQAEKGVGYFKLEKHALNLLIASPALWVLGSIHNSCQIYERADGQVQVLQQSVHIPFLMGSLLFLVGAILNRREKAVLIHHSLDLLGLDFVWFSISGSLLFFIGGLMNVVKVFKMLQIDDDLRPEKLRGGAQEKLIQERERDSEVPFIFEEQRRRKRGKEQERFRL